MADDLRQLAELHAAGQLTDDEYERAKAAVLAGVREGGDGGDRVVAVVERDEPPAEPSPPPPPLSTAARLRSFVVFVALGAAILAFFSAIVLTAAVPSLARLAAPVLCTGSHGEALVHTQTYRPEPGRTVRTLTLQCLDRATGDVHEPGDALTILVLFVEEAIGWFAVITVGWWAYLGVSRLRGAPKAVAT